MLRLRCTLGASFVALQREALVRRHGRCSMRPVGYALLVPNRMLHQAAPLLSALATQRRWVRTRGDRSGEESSADGSKQEGAEHAKAKGAQGEGGEKTGKKTTGFRAHLEGLREDYVRFPDIYNSANALNFILFTVFCLCSTGSNVEEKWWLDNWGVDARFAPLAWGLHSLLMNNFLSMTFAMMLLHTMCHSVLPTLGSRGLTMYCAITAVASGFLMWAYNYMMSNTTEKQFGPWDIVAALFVMQYLHQGFSPVCILNSFNGWVRYACWVGAVCILYFDWQPTVAGTIVGLALCKGHPKFRVTGPVS
ncbi:hypothetical protein TraAM80_01811 [Trypanosoma rangeli]|uniref:Uncharacterized protein n=1 Tax=Trypanosoma rangeli TaxID=5698 RepID=A0A3S5IS56_TRYRA|nr:uncharacterized protein TraAM80_01811 [Trypanosoma rangeli]RNF09972.1 hypothetical protein TraAM80_01811 [Trypanosoma rangeli]|eukprot:RNF09972.1 hypothetical protein TraAM80_01811 [Trypanosoma rangeli]